MVAGTCDRVDESLDCAKVASTVVYPRSAVLAMAVLSAASTVAYSRPAA